MAMLKGNDLSEWIKALEPVDWSNAVEHGSKMIHESSSTMEPLMFLNIQHSTIRENEKEWHRIQLQFGDPETGTVYEAHDYDTGDPMAGWFYFPEPAAEVVPLAASKGKVRELGDGKWKTLGRGGK